MTNREKEFFALGWEYCEGIDSASKVIVPATGREIRRTDDGWASQPWNDNYWRTFADLLDAAKFATPANRGGCASPSKFAAERAI